MRLVGEAIRNYNMIQSGDEILIGLSGGKDSLLLSLALAVTAKRSPIKFGLHAAFVDQTGGTALTDTLSQYMDLLGIHLTLIKNPTFKIIEDRDERSPCSLCANLRRGILASCAKQLNCNTIALGHHKDDTAETVLLNLFYGGRFKCYQPNIYMSRSGIRVIRPLIYIEEHKISAEASRLDLPITNSCCPYGKDTKRAEIKKFISVVEQDFPYIKSNIVHALENASEDDVWADKTDRR